MGIVLGYLGDRTPWSGTVPIGDLLVWVVPIVACHMCAFSWVVGGICSHLCCLFAFCVEENKSENKTNNNNNGGVWVKWTEIKMFVFLYFQNVLVWFYEVPIKANT